MIAPKIFEKYEGNRGHLIGMLQDIQEVHKYLPREEMEELAKLLDIPRSQVYAVATFFKAFSLEPKGKHIVCVCMGTACHVRGAQKVLDELERKLNVKSGKTTKDGNVTLETVNCLGACASGPLVVTDGTYHGQVIPSDIESMIHSISSIKKCSCECGCTGEGEKHEKRARR